MSQSVVNTTVTQLPDGSTLTTITYSDGSRSDDLTPAAGTPLANVGTLQQQALSALANNRTYVALTSPSNAQTATQVKALSRQMNGVIRLLLQQLDGTD